MKIWLIRHAKAESHSGGPDADRALTGDGATRFAQEVERLARLDTRFDRLYYSPSRRTTETARLLAPLLDGDAIPLEGLAREPDADLLDALEGHEVAVVGHEPWLTELAGLLSLGHREAGRAFELKKGGVISLEGEPTPAGMRIRAFLPAWALRDAG